MTDPIQIVSDFCGLMEQRDATALKPYLTGDAVYLGPTLYWQIAPKVIMSAAWEAQIAGRERGVGAALDLTDFSRQRARLLFEFEF